LSRAWRAVKPQRLGLGVAICVVMSCDAAAVGDGPGFRAAPGCGDGVVQEGEACDLGFANRSDGPCRACQWPRCGDGVVDPGEDCDAGEDDPGGACTVACAWTWPRSFTRTVDTGLDDEGIADLVVLGDGDFVHVGAGHEPGTVPARVSVTRRTAAGDARWTYVAGASEPGEAGVATAAVLAPTGDLYLTGWVGISSPRQAWVGALAVGDGNLRWAVGLGDGVGVDVAAGPEGGWVAIDDEAGAGSVRPFSAAGQVLSPLPWPQDLQEPPRALAAWNGGVVVGTGSMDTPGSIARLGSGAWELRRIVDRGEVVAFDASASESLLAVATAVLGRDESLPGFAQTAAVDVFALGPGGTPIWSTRVAPDYGPRRAAAIARSGAHVVVAGRDPIPYSACGERLCPARPWLSVFDPTDGELAWTWLPEDVPLGSADALAFDGDDVLLVGGSTHARFARPDGWLLRLQVGGERG
jgi:hypothetical protein